MRSDRKPILAFLASGLLFVQFLLTAFGPFDVDKPRPSELAVRASVATIAVRTNQALTTTMLGLSRGRLYTFSNPRSNDPPVCLLTLRPPHEPILVVMGQAGRQRLRTPSSCSLPLDGRGRCLPSTMEPRPARCVKTAAG